MSPSPASPRQAQEQPQSSVLIQMVAWPALLAALLASVLLYLPTLGHWWNSEDVWQVAAKPWSAIPAMFDLGGPSRSFYLLTS